MLHNLLRWRTQGYGIFVTIHLLEGGKRCSARPRFSRQCLAQFMA